MRELIFIFSAVLLSISTLSAKEVAITFDDAPRPDTAVFTGEERSKRLMKALQKAKVRAMFFVTTNNLNKNTMSRAKAYQNAGHYLANHSDQHLWLYKTALEQYQQDILTADKKMQALGAYQRFYRFPFLDEGRGIEKRDAIRAFLSNNQYQNGYVTIDNYDWYLDSLLQKAHKADNKIDLMELEKLYLEVIVDAAEFYDAIAQKYLGRSPKHVLLLHENDLAALYIDKLIAALRTKGWKIIDPVDAYADPIAKVQPNTLFNGQGRVAALARMKGAKPQQLIHKAEDEAYLDAEFKQRVVKP